MNTKEPIAVLAGTPVDTQMGVDVLAGAGLMLLFLVYYSISRGTVQTERGAKRSLRYCLS